MSAGRTGPAAGRRLLVVDDDPAVTFILQEVLADLGHTVVGPAGSLAEARALLADGPPDAALLDLQLGDEASDPIAAALAAAGVPFVFLTGREAADLPPSFSAAPVLTKPFDLDVLEQLVDDLVGQLRR